MTCPKPGCTQKLFVSYYADEGVCPWHGPIFIGTPVDISAKETRVQLPSLRKAHEFAPSLLRDERSGLPTRVSGRGEAVTIEVS